MKYKIVKMPLIVIAGIFIVIVLLNTLEIETSTSEEFFTENLALGWTSFEVNGSVQDKFISNSHNRPIVIIKNSDGIEYRFYFQTNDEEFYNYIQLGDSVHSERFSGKARVWNENKTRHFNFIE